MSELARRMAESRIRAKVMVDSIGGVEELMRVNVGARLAATYHQLKTSVSPLALGAAWGRPAARREYP